MVRARAAAATAALILLAAAQGLAAGAEFKPDDAARYLAGMPSRADSALRPDPAWQQHAKLFDAAWQKLERGQLSKIRAWSAEHIKAQRSPLLYMFSGPDFLYADAFFPDAPVYVLVGLEAVGRVPESGERLRLSLPRLRSSLNASLNLTFFITRQMREQLTEGELTGTLPILYVFIARAGKTIREVELVGLDKDGNLVPAERDARRAAPITPGVKIVFARADGPPQTLYYFRADLSDSGLKSSGFLKFSEQLGRSNSLLKSASYLLHQQHFSRIRQFLLERSKLIVQDDSGIPVLAFKPDEWRLKPFGTYQGPIGTFAEKYQTSLRQLYQRGLPQRLEFGIGYRWRANESNLLLAIRRDAQADERQSLLLSVPRTVEPATPVPARDIGPTPASRADDADEGSSRDGRE